MLPHITTNLASVFRDPEQSFKETQPATPSVALCTGCQVAIESYAAQRGCISLVDPSTSDTLAAGLVS